MVQRTGSPHRVFLTVLISVLIGSPSTESLSLDFKERSSEENHFRAVPLQFLTAEEYNPFDAQDILKYSSQNRPRPSPISSEYENSNSKYLSSNPLSFTVTRSSSASSKGKPKRKPLHDCLFGYNCPEANPPADFSSFHAAVNGVHKDRFSHKLGKPFADNSFSIGDSTTKSIALPFSVQGHKKSRIESKTESSSQYPTITRRTRTTTPEPGPAWVKLQPVAPQTYDPFAKNGSSGNSTSSSQFASRMELSPETFAERYGWKDGKYSGPGGSKPPSWLEELNYQHGGYVHNRRPGYDHGDDRDSHEWVKLDAIPVTGVKIAKWVPKNTSPSELPSTSFKRPGKPTWWDRIDSPPESHSRPYPSGSRWPARYPERPQKHFHDHNPTDSWGDVIYPSNNPVSATASWSSDKKPSSVGLGWQKVPPGTRYPAVASWSSPGSNRPSSSFNYRPYQSSGSSSSYPGGKPSYYPDPDSKDDNQWVLISSSSNKDQIPAGSNHHSIYEEFPYKYNNNRQKKGINLTGASSNKYSTATFPSLNFGSGFATTVNKLGNPALSPRPIMTQDELFRRTNETLHSLKPFLKYRDPSATPSPPLTQTLIDMITSTAANIVESTTTKYSNLGFGKRSSTPPTKISASKPKRKRRLLGDVNPVYAAIGAGMIPATFGAVVPMLLGRKRREIKVFQDDQQLSHFLNTFSNSNSKVEFVY